MKVPLSWLRDYVRVDLSPAELAHRLSMAGTEVEKVERVGYKDGVVVGHVLDVSPHPHADRLRLVTVDHGNGVAEVVCGAPNVAAGQKIAFASVGAELIDGYTGRPSRLKRAKIRGVVSEGMVCSEKELGLGDEHDGILVLDTDEELGAPIGQVIGDTILELELTPNRPDCLGIVGVAREVAAVTGARLVEPNLDYETGADDAADLARLAIEDSDLCPRYTASVIRGVKIGPSPKWLKDALLALGERPINNVVDATNYVMFELGQPLHAFDYDRVVDHTVVVRRANEGERLTTLDDVERELSPDVLVIADPMRAIGLAGVMGGANTEIGGGTVNILLESAAFDPSNNRRTSQSLSLTSQASLRFEKGLRAGLSEVALRRATRLILEVAGGEAAKGILDEWPGKADETDFVYLSRQKLDRVLGAGLADAQVESTLTSLGFSVSADGEGWNVKVPYWRPDVGIPEDLCEEVARIIGYDELPLRVHADNLPPWSPNPELDLRGRVRAGLTAAGLQQIITYSGTTAEGEERLDLPSSTPEFVHILNPVSAGHSVLRRTLREGILHAVANNLHTWRGPIALFESGKVFHNRGEGLPDEREMAVGALAGPRAELHWDGGGGQLDYYDARGVVEDTLERMGIAAEFSPVEDATLAAGRAAEVTVPAAGGLRVGVVGEVAAHVLEAFGIDSGPVSLFELDLPSLESAVSASQQGGAYRTYIRFPESPRDLAVVVDETVAAADVVRVASRNRLVTSATVFDVYRGSNLPEGKKSLAVRLVYQSPSRTLTAGQVEKAQRSILNALSREFGALQRQ